MLLLLLMMMMMMTIGKRRVSEMTLIESSSTIDEVDKNSVRDVFESC